MNKGLQKIQQIAVGLFYLSESDYPFEVIQLKVPENSLERELIGLTANVPDAKVEQVSLDQFFRNMVKVFPDATPEQKEIASKYQQLQTVLKEELQDVSVYRIGEVQVDAFIIGKLQDGSFGGLRTKVVET